MNKYKPISHIIYCIICIFIILLLIQQIVINPLYIFKEAPADVDTSKILVNETYLKQRYVFERGLSFDSFIMGASTASNVRLSSESGGKWYNFSGVYFTLWETERFIQKLIKSGFKIKYLVIALSEENLKNNEHGSYIDICKSRTSVQFYPVPYSFKEKIYFYTKNFLTFPFFTIIKDKITTLMPKSANEIPDERYKPDFNYTDEEVIYRLPMVKNPFVQERLEEIKKITDLCKRNNIDVFFYFTPVYHQVYKNGILEDYNNFKREIVKITPFYDFTGLNPVTTNHRYFSDLIHGTEETGKLISDRIFYQDKNNPPKIRDFGIYVTQDNIESHIKKMNEQMEIQ